MSSASLPAERATSRPPLRSAGSGRYRIASSNPVEQVAWRDCDRLLRGWGLDLPTEAQWEYGCRGGTATPWWTGAKRESLLDGGPAANIADGTAAKRGAQWPSLRDWPEYDDGWLIHAAVDALRANPFGLHHVHGNVWEWCRDWHREYTVPVRPGDGLRPGIDPRLRGITRGGGYDGSPRIARSSHRDRGGRELRESNTGVRAARALR